jgi:hypothetical protein
MSTRRAGRGLQCQRCGRAYGPGDLTSGLHAEVLQEQQRELVAWVCEGCEAHWRRAQELQLFRDRVLARHPAALFLRYRRGAGGVERMVVPIPDSA